MRASLLLPLALVLLTIPLRGQAPGGHVVVEANPEDDAHSFVLPDLVVPLPGQTVTRATYVARHRGILNTCSVAAHLPSMWGQLIVLSRDAIGAPAP